MTSEPLAPKVTVLMPVRNGERYLRQSMESVLGQTFGGFELLVIDDGSTDGSPEIVASYRDRRIRLVRNDPPAGVALALDRGLALARGSYLARIDCDDVSVPQRLERQARYLDEHPLVGAVGSAVAIIDAAGAPVGTFRYPREHDHIRWALFFYTPLAHPSVMVRAEAVRAAGGYAPAWRAGDFRFFPEDYDLWRRMTDVARLANLPDVLLRLRKHDGNVMKIHADEYLVQVAQIARIMIAERLGEEVPERVAACLRSQRCAASTEVDAVCGLVRRISDSFLRDGAVEESVKGPIRREAADLVLAIAWQNRRHLRIGTLLGLARREGLTGMLSLGPAIARKVRGRILRIGRPAPG